MDEGEDMGAREGMRVREGMRAREVMRAREEGMRVKGHEGEGKRA